MTTVAASEVAAAPAARARAGLLLPHLGLLTTMVVWAAHATVMKIALRSVGPLALSSARFAIGALALIAIGLASGQPLRRRPPLRLLLPATMFGLVLNPLGFTLGLHLSTAVDLSVIMGLAPIAAAGLLFAVARRPLPPRRLAGLVLGFAGLVLVVAATAHRDAGTGRALLGDLLGLIAPLSWAAYILIAARAARSSSAIVFMAWSMVLAQVVLLPLMLAEAGRQHEAWQAALPWLAASGVIATGAGYGVYFWALPRLGVAETAVYTYLQPLLGAAAGALFLGEALGPWQVAGAAAIVGAAYLGTWSRA